MLESIFASYPTFLLFLSIFLGIVVTIVVMPAWIRFLRSANIGQEVRDDGPETHLVKQGTPTMGGLMMLVAVVVASLLTSKISLEMVVLLLAILATGSLGFFDDAAKVIRKQSLGLTPKGKLIGQFAIAAAFAVIAVNFFDIAPTIDIPFVCTIDLGVFTTEINVGSTTLVFPWLYLIYAIILLVGMCNAVNLTDGLDGLASGTVMIVMIVMAAIAYRADLLDTAIVSSALAGACIGFLWFNAHPADIFMGDTGSLALGMGLGCLSILTKSEFIVIIIGGLFVLEALSVMIQVMHYKRTKKRIFLMAPLHHHFEKKGWSETKVVIRFWLISGVFAATGFSLYFAASAFGA